MGMAILRTAKLTNWGNVTGSGSHIARQRDTPNADPDAPAPIHLIGAGDLLSAVQGRIEEAGVRVAKNAVLAVEVMLSASPEYFRPENPGQAGFYVPARLEAWQQAITAWAREQWADNLVALTVHLDEATPHAHAVVVPVNPKTNRLSAKAMITGGKAKLRQLQDSYAAALAPLGLQRGIKGSRAKHKRIKDVYGILDAPTPAIEPVPEPPASLLSATRRQWAEEQTRRIEEREQILRDQATAGRIAQYLAHDQAAAVARAEQAAELARLAADAERQAAEKARAEVKQLREQLRIEANRLRALPLDRVLEAAGLERDPADPKKQWHGQGHRINVTDRKFYDHDQGIGGGGAIDLAMHLTGADYKDAVAWLAFVAGERAVIAEAAGMAAERARNAAQEGRSSAPPLPSDRHWERVRRYLVDGRGLDLALVDQMHAQGQVYADARANAVFLSGDGQGVELRGTGNRQWRGYRGRKVAPFAVMAPGSGPDDSPDAVAVVESAIDAIAYSQLHPGTIAVSLGGSGSRDLFSSISEQARKMRVPVVWAGDNDEGGEYIERRLVMALDHRQKNSYRWDQPRNGCKDWGEVVQRKAKLAASRRLGQPQMAPRSSGPRPG